MKYSPTATPFPAQIFLLAFLFSLLGCENKDSSLEIPLQKGDRIVLLGNNLGARLMLDGYFETEVHLRNPEKNLFIRNMCDAANTPGFRPHSGRFTPWPFPGAENFQDELANFSDSQGHFETPDQWLTRLKADLLLAFFGYNESFNGEKGINTFKEELDAFVRHSLSKQYNGESPPQLILVSPIAFEDLSSTRDLPDGVEENQNLAIYSQAIKEVAEKYKVPFVDIFNPSKEWYREEGPLTQDGFQLNSKGNQILSRFLAQAVFGGKSSLRKEVAENVRQAVLEKNWYWHDDYKSPNGVHVFGRRYQPFGPENYPFEIEKKRQMTAIRDSAIWKVLQGETLDLDAADASSVALPPVETSYQLSNYGRGPTRYLYGEEALDSMQTASGYSIELFASEKEFPDLANPVQISFDNKGRLWVAVMPTYPHYRPGDQKPNDKLLILEDTDGDFKADKQTIFAAGLHLPVGFELAPEGVYVSQGTHLKLLKDTDGDDQADSVEIVLSGFDDHDTHHTISAFCADPSGAIYMGEGVFLHSNIETAYGPIRATNGGFYRYSPQRNHLERVAQVPIPNPWGTAFDRWGQPFFLETSGPMVRWMLPGTLRPRYGRQNQLGPSLLEEEDMVRPTSGLEFVSSRHFPEEVQGDLLLGNTIGFLGLRQHKVSDDGTGYHLNKRHDLVSSSDGNFRPVDLEFAPDGSLYLADWHNVLIGHMQHNARDPLRDHQHGRIYRITYPDRPLVTPAKIDQAPILTLLNNLKLPEYRSRYRSRRELRGRDADEVARSVKDWVQTLDQDDPDYGHHLLEALWVSWGANRIDEELLEKLLEDHDARIRAAAVHVLRYAGHQLKNQTELLSKMASDPSSRVRMEVLTAASWLDPNQGIPIVETVGKQPMDVWFEHAYPTALAHLQGKNYEPEKTEIYTHLKGNERERYIRGKETYEREGYCITCHQKNGQGLTASGFPPLTKTKWVLESEERLIKLSLKGLIGPMIVKEAQYEGRVPMTGFGQLLTDQEIADVLTYVRNSFGNRASVITDQKVREVRQKTADKKGYYNSEELLQAHPHIIPSGKNIYQ